MCENLYKISIRFIQSDILLPSFIECPNAARFGSTADAKLNTK